MDLDATQPLPRVIDEPPPRLTRGDVGTVPSLPPVHEAWLPREHMLHRPRHGGRQLLALACAAVFFAGALLAQLAGARAAEIENRPLAPLPTPADGWAMFTELRPWATDHLPFRAEAIKLVDAVSRGVFREPPALGEGTQGSGPLPSDRQQEQPQRPPEQISVPDVIEGTQGWLYLGAEVESRCNAEIDVEWTFEQLTKLREGVEASGRTFVLVVAPDKLTMVPEFLPQRYAVAECAVHAADEFWDRVRTEDFALDLRQRLATLGDQRGSPVYPQLDAHWADEGGLVMARALAEAVSPGVTASWVVEGGPAWTEPADLPPLIGRSGDAHGQHYMVRSDGVTDATRQIDERFSDPLHLQSTAGSGRVPDRVGLLADSFTVRALRYLPAAFSDITVLHHGGVLEDNGAAAAQMLVDTDIVAFEVVERLLLPKQGSITRPEVIETIVDTLVAHPIR